MNTITVLLLGILSSLSFTLIAQPDIEWEYSYGGSQSESVQAIVPALGGGYVLAGGSHSSDGDASKNNGGGDFWVFKIDESGILQWEQTLGGSAEDFFNDIQVTPDSGFVVIGTTGSRDFDMRGNHGTSDAVVVKLTKDGSIEWTKILGRIDADSGASILTTKDGGYILAGSSFSTYNEHGDHNGKRDIWVAKLNATGELEWQKFLGGSRRDYGLAIQHTHDGGYILAGKSKSKDGDVSNNYGGRDYWLIKLNEIGEIEWERSFGRRNDDFATDVVSTKDGGYIIAGYTESRNLGEEEPCNGSNFWLVKVSGEGDLVWESCFGGNIEDAAHCLRPTSDGAYIVAGYTAGMTEHNTIRPKDVVSGHHGNYDYWVVKFSDEGELIWQKCLGGSAFDIAVAAIQTRDGGYLVAGHAMSTDGDVSNPKGKGDAWVVKLSPDTESNQE